MNYELAKKLNNAGFPQRDILDGEQPNGWVSKDNEHSNWQVNTDEYVYVPTLSELIEACGSKDFFLMSPTDVPLDHLEDTGYGSLLHKTSNGSKFWRVGSFNPQVDSDVIEGSTPEEALVNLWLAINKKQ